MYLCSKQRGEEPIVKKISQWKEVVAISCSRSGIGALQRDGSVKLAGNIRGIAEVQEEWKKKASKVQSELQQGAVL